MAIQVKIIATDRKISYTMSWFVSSAVYRGNIAARNHEIIRSRLRERHCFICHPGSVNRPVGVARFADEKAAIDSDPVIRGRALVEKHIT